METFLADFGLLRSENIASLPLHQPTYEPCYLLPITEKEDTKKHLVPFSSPIGRALTRSFLISPEEIAQKQASIEELCEAKMNTILSYPLRKIPRKKKLVPFMFKRMKSSRLYNWPRHHHRPANCDYVFRLINRHLFEKLKPLSVIVVKVAESEVESYRSLKSGKVRVIPMSDEMINQHLSKKAVKNTEREE